jgi:PAS domain-containing protein
LPVDSRHHSPGEHARLERSSRACSAAHQSEANGSFAARTGRTFFGEVSARRLPDSRLIGVLRDISDRKRIEEQLRQSEARYRLIVQNQTEFIVSGGLTARGRSSNEHYCRLFGVTERSACTSFLPLVAREHQADIHTASRR